MIISAHAVEQYRVRIRVAPPERARYEIEAALARPFFVCRSASGDILYGIRNCGGFVFVAVVDFQETVTTVGPCWYWHEAKSCYRKLMRSKRKWK